MEPRRRAISATASIGGPDRSVLIALAADMTANSSGTTIAAWSAPAVNGTGAASLPTGEAGDG